MNHSEILHALADYLDGSLDPERREAVEAHLKACPSCARELEELQKTVGHIKSLGPVEAPSWMTGKVMALVREEAETKKPAWSRFFRGFRFPAEVLGLLLLTVAALFIYRSVQPGREFSEQPPARTGAPLPAPASKDRFEAASPAPTLPQSSAPDKEAPAPRPSAPAGDGASATKPPAARAVPEAKEPDAAGTAAANRGAQKTETAGNALLIRIQARGEGSRARIEAAIKEAGGTVVSRDVLSEGWGMTVQVDQARYAPLLQALRSIGQAEERTLAIDGREGREILMRDKPKAAVGC